MQESYALGRDARTLVRSVRDRAGRLHVSTVVAETTVGVRDDLAAAFDAAWLRMKERPTGVATGRSIRVADVFSGCGGMTIGVAEACRALSCRMEPVVAVDMDKTALATYAANFPGALTLDCSITDLVSGRCGSPLSPLEREIRKDIGRIDVLVGGPPCQGHSNLNNHTRRRDPRNALLYRMARLAEVLQPSHVIVENVRDVLRDRGHVLSRTIRSLEACGYSVDGGVARAAALGVPQSRVRYFLVASRLIRPRVSEWLSAFRQPTRTVEWALRDLVCATPSAPFDSASRPSPENARRIAHLFDRDLHDLPNAQRPPCHQGGGHTYWAIYGRLWWDKPAPTLTTGFGCTGQGRNVHPELRRTITPHEAARLQFIPDFFRFGALRRTALAKQIGNAVPPKIVYTIALNLLG